MEFNTNDLIDNRFLVKGICSNSGGMGQVLFVEDITKEFDGELVLKYCREQEDEYIKRFTREVRLTEGLKENSKVVDIFFSNTSFLPPLLFY